MPGGNYAFGAEYPYLETTLRGEDRRKLDDGASKIIEAVRKLQRSLIREPCMHEHLKDAKMFKDGSHTLPDPIGELPQGGLDSKQCKNVLAEWSALQSLEMALVKLGDHNWTEEVDVHKNFRESGAHPHDFEPWMFTVSHMTRNR